MKKELYEKIKESGILTEDEQNSLELEPINENADLGMYKIKAEPKNMNRVIAGLKSHNNPFDMNTSNQQNGNINPRYIEALEMQLQQFKKQFTELHGAYNRLLKSHNQVVNRLNEVTERLNKNEQDMLNNDRKL